MSREPIKASEAALMWFNDEPVEFFHSGLGEWTRLNDLKLDEMGGLIYRIRPEPARPELSEEIDALIESAPLLSFSPRQRAELQDVFRNILGGLIHAAELKRDRGRV